MEKLKIFLFPIKSLLIVAIVAQHSFTWDNPNYLHWGFSIALTGLLFIVWLWVFRAGIKQAIIDWRLIPFLGAGIVVAYCVSLFIRQQAAPEYYRHTYGVFFGKLITLIYLDSIYGSWWFQCLFVLLFLHLAGTLFGSSFETKKLAANIARLGGLIIVVNIFLLFYLRFQGVIFLEKEIPNTGVRLSPGNYAFNAKVKTLDFTLTLNDVIPQFSSEYFLQAWKKTADSLPLPVKTYNARDTATLYRSGKGEEPIPSFQVASYIPHFKWEYRSTKREGEVPPKDPLLILNIKTPKGEEAVQLRANYDGYDRLSDPLGQANILFKWTLPTTYRAIISGRKKLKATHRLKMIDGDGKISQLDIELGKYYPLRGTPYRLYFKKIYDHLLYSEEKDKFFNGSVENANPAVQLVLLNKNDTVVDFFLYSGNQPNNASPFTQVKLLTKFDFHYDYDQGNRILIVGKEKKIYYVNADTVVSENIKFNVPYPLGGRLDSYFLISYCFPDAKFVEPVPMQLDTLSINPIVKIKYFNPPVSAYIAADKEDKNHSVLPMGRSDYFLTLEKKEGKPTPVSVHLTVADKPAAADRATRLTIRPNQTARFNNVTMKTKAYDPEIPDQIALDIKYAPDNFLFYLGGSMVLVGMLLQIRLFKKTFIAR